MSYTHVTGEVSVYVDAGEPHSYRCASESEARAIVITTLPRA